MAKAKQVRADVEARGRSTSESVAETTPDLSAKVANAIDEVRKPFLSYVKHFAALATRREELAPKFIKAAGLWQAEQGGTFVDFVRYLVPEIGKARAEYRQHRAYQAADYLRRLVSGAATNRRGRTAAERATAPAPPTDVMARVIASMMALIPEGQQGRFWEALSTEAHWTDRQVQRIQTQVEHVDPLVEIRGRTLETLRLTIPAHEEKAAA